MPTARSQTTSRPASGSRERRVRLSPRLWTSAIRATWSGLRNLLPDFAALASRRRGLLRLTTRLSAAQIAKDHARLGRIWCPHTATGFSVYDRLPHARKIGRPWIVRRRRTPRSSSASSSRVIGQAVPVPAALAALLGRPARSIALAAGPCEPSSGDRSGYNGNRNIGL